MCCNVLLFHLFFILYCQLEGIEVRTTDVADDFIKGETCPGKPFIVYQSDVSQFLYVFLNHLLD
jgi:hypothetical protein